MADTAFNLTFNSSTGKVSVSRATAPNIDAAGPLGGEFTTLTPSQTVRMRKALDGVTGGYAAAELHYITVVNNANIYNSIIDENGVDAPELSTARQVLEASNLVQPGFGGGLAAALQAQWALQVRAEYDEGLADIGVSPEDRASIIDKVVADILGQGLPVTPETFDDAFDRHPEAQQYIQDMEDSGGAEKITKESPETGGNVVYYVAPDGTLSKTKVISYNPDNGETGSADVVTADYKFVDGKWVRDARLGDTTINQSAEEFMQQLQGSGFTSLAEAVAASLRIQRSHVMEPEEPVVPSTPTSTPSHRRPDRGDDTAAVVVAPVEPTIEDVAGDNTNTIGAGYTYDTGGVTYTGDITGANIPVILDLDGDGVEVAFGEDIYFDLDDDGFLEQTSWASADDGFLVIDLTADGTRGAGDGVIDQSNELVLSSLGVDGDTDLQALARYDLSTNGGNNNGKLDSGDAIWNELKVWQDLSQDGKTEGDGTELKTLAAWGISSINIAYDDGINFIG